MTELTLTVDGTTASIIADPAQASDALALAVGRWMLANAGKARESDPTANSIDITLGWKDKP